ncbi:hypothetical protein SEPCBS119000_004190 [Sporothrix epigloea]|uniref:DH domain-containing protein n=1 Tax=Sporothrix epigloea TaxID=1892477 RepID=A0ABP0DQQ5_9PEZI
MSQNADAGLHTDWYRSATSYKAGNRDTPAAQVSVAASTTARPPAGHSRAHSDFADAKPTYQKLYHHQPSLHNASNALPLPSSHLSSQARFDGAQNTDQSTRRNTSVSDLPQSPTSPTSRLPISVRNLSVASGRSSPSSTRSDSSMSAAERRPATVNRVPRQQQPHGPPISSPNVKASTRRAATPTSTPVVRTKTSATTPTSLRRVPPAQTTTLSNTDRVGTIKAAPPATLPLPLRNSQSRLPASSATASSASRFGRTPEASSSSSTAGRSRLPGPGNFRNLANRQDEPVANRRKIDVGPIDFAQRRETIRLKYSKSIRDTEASAARQAAAERRKKELDAAAKAKALAEAAVRAQSEAGRQVMANPAPALSTKSSATSLSTMSNAAASATSGPAAAAVARSASDRLPAAPNATRMDATVALQPSTTTSDSSGNTTPPVPLLPAAAGEFNANAAVSPTLRSSPRQALPSSTAGLSRKSSLQNAKIESPSLTLSTLAVEAKPAHEEWILQDGDSPTLGLPGTYFSGVYSPPPNEEVVELPPPAISVDSAIPKPDSDSQKESPRQEATDKPQAGGDARANEQREGPDSSTSRTSIIHPIQGGVLNDSGARNTLSLRDRDPVEVFDMSNDANTEQSADTGLSPFDRSLPGSYPQSSFESRPETPLQKLHAVENLEQSSVLLNQTPRPKRELRHVRPHEQMKQPANGNTTVNSHAAPALLYNLDGVDDDKNAIGIAVSSIISDEDSHPKSHSTRIDPEYEITPFRTDVSDVKTTVTILGRETDVPSRRPSLSHLNKSSARLDVANESDSNIDGDSYGSCAHSNIVPPPDPSLLLSGSSDESRPSERSARGLHSPSEMSNSLDLPSLTSPFNRLSQHSGWTDFSIESEDARAFLALRAATTTLSQEDLSSGSADKNATLRARVSPFLQMQNQQASQERGRRRDPYQSSSWAMWMDDDKEHSQRDEKYSGVYVGDSPDSESMLRSDKKDTSTMLPQVDTDTNFFIPYLMDDQVTGPHIPVLPDHDPPPIPVSVDGRDSFTENSIRPSSSSACYDSSRPNSFALGMRDDQDGQDSFVFGDASSADDYILASLPPMMAMQSSEQAPHDLSGQSISGTTLIDSERPSGLDGAADVCDDDAPPSNGGSKEQSRLVQRQMVIRELIDTEAIFVRDMNIVEEIYKGTADSCPHLDSNTVKLIFRNTDEIIAFHTAFLVQLKDAVSTVYVPKGNRRTSPPLREDSILSDSATLNSTSAESVSGSTVSSSSTTAAATTGTISDDTRDRQTCLGPAFHQNINQMRITHESFLRSSDSAAKRLIQIQDEPTVKLWLTECNEVAQELTAAWNLDSLLIKPMQRITKYPNLISQLLQYTPDDHPDRASLMTARTTLEDAILEINKTKKNFELVGQIVGRKRKDSDVRAGFARAFGKRVDKLQVSSNRPPEDHVYAKLNEKFADDYLRLQVVLRDVEFYTRQVSTYVHEFLQLLSAMELVMRLQSSSYPELESKWASFNVSMRDMEKVALEQHLTQVRKQVIEPFELVIKCYGNPSLAMKKRAKRRLDYERAAQLKKGGKKVDKQLAELVEQYDALNETLKKELPILSANTEKIGNICLGNFVNIQIQWFAIWKEKVKVVLEDQQNVPAVGEIMSCFARDFKDVEEYTKQSLTFLTKGAKSMDLGSPPPGGIGMLRTRSGRPSDAMSPRVSPRARGESVNSDSAPSLPAPDFGGRNSGQFTFSSTTTNTSADAGGGGGTVPGLGVSASSATSVSSPQPVNYRDDFQSGLGPNNGSNRSIPNSSVATGMPAEPALARAVSSANASHSGFSAAANVSGRPNTGRINDSMGNTAPRPSIDSLTRDLPAVGQSSMATVLQASHRDSASTYDSAKQYMPGGTAGVDNSVVTSSFGDGDQRPPTKLEDGLTPTVETIARSNGGCVSQDCLAAEGASQYSSRALSRERASTAMTHAPSTAGSTGNSDGNGNGHSSAYKVLWLAASLYEFNIETKHEAGYPYLTYQAGEIFDVIAEKGELWLAKNQDDPSDLLGWIWSKHFAKLADS